MRECVHASLPPPSPPLQRTRPPPPQPPKTVALALGLDYVCSIRAKRSTELHLFFPVRACVRMQVDEQVLLVLRVVEYGARGVARVPVRQRTLRTSAGATELASCDGHVVPFLSSMRLRVESTRGEPVYILSHACVFGRLVSAAFPSSVSYGRCCHPAMMLQA